jgi:hypothetical protein
VRKQEKTRENERKQEKLKYKLKFLKILIDKAVLVWYYSQAE